MNKYFDVFFNMRGPECLSGSHVSINKKDSPAPPLEAAPLVPPLLRRPG